MGENVHNELDREELLQQRTSINVVECVRLGSKGIQTESMSNKAPA